MKEGPHTISTRLCFGFVFNPMLVRHLDLILEITSWIWKHETILENGAELSVWEDRSIGYIMIIRNECDSKENVLEERTVKVSKRNAC